MEARVGCTWSHKSQLTLWHFLIGRPTGWSPQGFQVLSPWQSIFADTEGTPGNLSQRWHLAMVKARALDRSWAWAVVWEPWTDYLFFKGTLSSQWSRSWGQLRKPTPAWTLRRDLDPCGQQQARNKVLLPTETPHESRPTPPTLEKVSHSSKAYRERLAHLGDCFGLETESY